MKRILISILLGISILSLVGCTSIKLDNDTVRDVIIDTDTRDTSEIKSKLSNYIKDVYGRNYEDKIKIVAINSYKNKLIIDDDSFEIPHVDLENQKGFFKEELIKYQDVPDYKLPSLIYGDIVDIYGFGVVTHTNLSVNPNKTVTVTYKDQSITIDKP